MANTNTAAATVADTILQQLGGARFIAMTGARGFVGTPSTLRFKLPTGTSKDGANMVIITLTAMDDYLVETISVRSNRVTPKSLRSGVYADSLRDVFTSLTGLQTSLGTMGGGL